MFKNSNSESKSDSVNLSDPDDFIRKCVHDIRNFRTLTKDQLDKINQMDFYSRQKILNTYNEVVEYLNSYLNN